MSFQAEASAVVRPASGQKRRAVLWLAVTTFLLILFGWFLALRPISANNLVWLTPAQMARATQAGPFTKIKLKMARFMGPLMNFYWRNRPNILTRSTLMALSMDAAQHSGLPAASSATNADGTRVWILSAAELKVLQQRLKVTPSASVLNTASMITLSGRRGAVGVGPIPGDGVRPASLIVDFTPKFVAGSIKIMLNAAATERTQTLPGGTVVIRTNIAVTCHASLPNAGALLVDASDMPYPGPTNYWLIISPTAVDAKGNPL